MHKQHLISLVILGAMLTGAVAAQAQQSSWQWRQADLEVARLTGEIPEDTRTFQSEFEGGTANVATTKSGKSPAIPMLMSLILPGSGELYLGHKRGWIQIALDAASWYGAASYNQEGQDIADEYYAYADDHWFEEKLDASYDRNYLSRPDANFDYTDVVGIGDDYFSPDPPGYTNIPLWVSKEDDRREYYENLGKWDQFVFGWDDFQDPRDFMDTEEIDIQNLKDARTSQHREEYRTLRIASNDAYATRDRFIYLSIAFRVFSVFQVAYLEGLLFGGGENGDEAQELKVGSHKVDFFVEPVGVSRGVMGATVSF